MKCSNNSVLRRFLCIYACLLESALCLQPMAFHLFMSYSVNVFTIFQNVLVAAVTVSLRHAQAIFSPIRRWCSNQYYFNSSQFYLFPMKCIVYIDIIVF